MRYLKDRIIIFTQGQWDTYATSALGKTKCILDLEVLFQKWLKAFPIEKRLNVTFHSWLATNNYIELIEYEEVNINNECTYNPKIS